MKLFIASDIHGSALYCSKMLELYKKETADRLVLLGDLLYHGPRNDLPDGYEPKKVISMLNEVKNEVLCVRGNCEAEVDGMVLEFPVLADYALICDGEVSIFATHGHLYNAQNPPPLKTGDILLCGHTHVPAFEKHGNFTYINPGSVSIPKENSSRGVIIYENGVFTRKDLGGRTETVFEIHK